MFAFTLDMIAGLATGYVAITLALVAHEGGHALGGWVAGLRVHLVEIGLGAHAVRLRRRPPAVVIHPLLPLGGACIVDGEGLVTPRWAAVLQVALGPGANLIAGATAAGIYAATGVGVLLLFAVVQGVFGLGQLIPLPALRITGGVATDGAQLLRELCGAAAAPDVDAVIARARDLRRLRLEAVAQRLLAGAAVLVAKRGQPERANALLEELGPPVDRTRAALVSVARVYEAIARGDLEVAEKRLGAVSEQACGLTGATSVTDAAQRAVTTARAAAGAR